MITKGTAAWQPPEPRGRPREWSALPAAVAWQAWMAGERRAGRRASPGTDRRNETKETRVQRWRGLADVPAGWGGSVVTIGVFDGVHRGHQYILNRAVEVARGLGNPMAVVTFDPHPSEVVRPGSHPALLCTASRRAELLAGLGANAVCILPFTPEFSRLSPEEFVRTVLVDRLHTAAVVVGENFRFGHRAAGDVAQLAELGGKYDFTVEGMSLLSDGGARICPRGIPQAVAARGGTRAGGGPRRRRPRAGTR